MAYFYFLMYIKSSFRGGNLSAEHSLEIIDQIHQKALRIAQSYKRCEVELIEVLEEADKHKVHYKLGFSSLFKYATDGLGLSPEVAYIFINVARKSAQIPALKVELKTGSITVSKAKRISSVINSENQSHWIELAKNSSKRELEKLVAAVNPKELIPEKIDFVHPQNEIREKVSLKSVASGDVRVQMQLGISEHLMLRLRRVQDVISQSAKRPVNLEEALAKMVDQFLTRNDPVQKAARQIMRGMRLGPGPVDSKLPSSIPISGRTSIKAQIRHQIYLKYRGRCAHTSPDGKRCEERRHLDIHHLVPVSKGGSNDVANLILLCSGHHKGIHS